MFYIHSSMMVCLKLLWTVRVWIFVFMAEIVVFYDFVHFVGKIDFVAEPHPYTLYPNIYFLISYHFTSSNTCLV
ncbi:hypothetical protein Hanom_Chr05g00436101 [Helianthus anomalus]